MMAIRKFASTSSTAHVVTRILTTGITGVAAITTHAEQLQIAPRYLVPATASSSLDASIHPNIQGSASVRMQNPLLHLSIHHTLSQQIHSCSESLRPAVCRILVQCFCSCNCLLDMSNQHLSIVCSFMVRTHFLTQSHL